MMDLKNCFLVVVVLMWSMKDLATASAQTPAVVVASPEETIKECARIDQERKSCDAFADRMIQLVDADTGDPMVRETAAFALCALRSIKAVPALARNLAKVRTYERPPGTLAPVIGMYPCALALVNIGTPALEGVIKVLRSSSDKTEIEIAAFTVSGILGKKEAAQFLQSQIEKAASDRIKQNVRSAAELIESSEEGSVHK